MMETLLSRAPNTAPPALTLLGQLSLRLARLHEVCGAARHTFALWCAAQTKGPVLWIAPDWAPNGLHADGVRPFLNPGHLIFVHPRRAEDILWTMEEALRSGATPLVVGDVPGPPGLTAVRRMHLAAQTGAQAGMGAPLGLLLTPADGGAPGVESRWHMAPRHSATDTLWHLERRRARTAPPQSWQITASAKGAQETTPALGIKVL